MLVEFIQMGVVEGDKSRAIDEAVKKVHHARGADLIVLPELWNIVFMSFDRYIPEAEDKSGPTLTTLRELSKEVKAYVYMGSFDDGVKSPFDS